MRAHTARPDVWRQTSEALLGDFRTDSRMLLLVAFALPLGVTSAFVARRTALAHRGIPNIVFFQRLWPEMERFSIIISERRSSRGRS